MDSVIVSRATLRNGFNVICDDRVVLLITVNSDNNSYC